MKPSNGLIDDAEKTLYGVNLLLRDLNRKIGFESDRDVVMGVLEILHDVKENIFTIEEGLFSNIKKATWEKIYGYHKSHPWRMSEQAGPNEAIAKEEENND